MPIYKNTLEKNKVFRLFILNKKKIYYKYIAKVDDNLEQEINIGVLLDYILKHV